MTREPSPLLSDATIRTAITMDPPNGSADALWFDLSDRLDATQQLHRRRFALVSPGLRVAFAAIAVIVVIGGGAYLIRPDQGVGVPPPTPQPTASSKPTPEPSAAQAQATVPADWTPYTSDRFAYSVEYPTAWGVAPATKDWTSPYPPDHGEEIADTFGPQPFGVRVKVTSTLLTTDIDAAARMTSFDTENAAFCNTLSNRHSIALDGVTARQEDQLCAQDVNVIQVLAATNDRFYAIDFVGDSQITSTDRATFDRFLASIRFAGPAPAVSPGTPPARAR